MPKRELHEEMGLIAEELEFFFVNSGPETHYIYPNGDEVSNFEIVFICKKWTGEPRSIDGEMEEVNYSATSNRASCFSHHCTGYDDT